MERYKKYKDSGVIDNGKLKMDNSQFSIGHYPLMKDSGVEWIGEIPEGWEVCFIKYQLSEITDGAHISPETKNGVFPFISTVDLKNGHIDFGNSLRTSKESFEMLAAQGCKPEIGDILFSKDGTIGRTCIVKEKVRFVVASSLIVLRITKNIVTNYLDYMLQSSSVIEQVNSFVKGSALRRLSLLNLKKIYGIFPPLEEPIAIVNYFDRKTAEIDQLIAQKERLLCLYEEEKTAIINQAVTQGIHPETAVETLHATSLRHYLVVGGCQRMNLNLFYFHVRQNLNKSPSSNT